MVNANSAFRSKTITIERFILEEQMLHHPEASGDLTKLLYDFALSAKFIATKTQRAGLVDVLDAREGDSANDPLSLSTFAERTIHRLNDHTGRLAVMASEDQPHIIPIPEKYGTGKYVLLYDALDGSSNIDYNVSMGTVFAIYERISTDRGRLEDCLQKGSKLVAAGYVIYGSSTMLVYSSGQGVHGFTLDPTIGEFLLSHPNIKYPDAPRYYSVNQGYQCYWTEGDRRFTNWLQGDGRSEPLSLRYIGSLVADFHRNLLAGGVFYYPIHSRDAQSRQGKMHLIYEANPLAYLAEQAGGYASNGQQRILDIQPTSLQHRLPFYVGNRELVEKAEEFLQKEVKMAVAA